MTIGLTARSWMSFGFGGLVGILAMLLCVVGVYVGALTNCLLFTYIPASVYRLSSAPRSKDDISIVIYQPVESMNELNMCLTVH